MRSSPPGTRSASGSSPRRSRRDARSTSTSASSASSRGCAGWHRPSPAARWDDAAAAAHSGPEERADAVEAYSAAFVAEIRPPRDVGPILAALAERFPLAVLSNWPLAATIDRFVAEAGWGGYFRAIVVSQRVGSIKPSPEIFAVAAAALGMAGERILHVGDDWPADVVGAKRAGWLAAYLRDRQGDSPLPSSVPDELGPGGSRHRPARRPARRARGVNPRSSRGASTGTLEPDGATRSAGQPRDPGGRDRDAGCWSASS